MRPNAAFRAAGLAFAAAQAGACRDPGGWQTTQSRLRAASDHDLRVALTARPALTYHPDRAVTEVTLTYVVRDADQVPRGAAETHSDILVDGLPLDPESQWRDAAQMPPLRVLYSLVLDTTYSLVAQGEAPMKTMLAAAAESIGEGQRLVAANENHVLDWRLSWFDDYVYHPLPEDSWEVEDIQAIPPPRRGPFTRMRAAVADALERARQHQAQDPTGRWQHVLVLFSDGADNHSSAQLPDPQPDTGSLGAGRTYACRAASAVDEPTLLETVKAFDGLTLHTIGIGPPDLRQASQLERLAEAGRGTYQHEPDIAALPGLFARVTREFTTVQTRQVVLPQASGDYLLTLRVQDAGVGRQQPAASGEVTVRLHLGDPQARPLGTDGPG